MQRYMAVALLCGATLTHAQSPTKKELVQKVLRQQQPALEGVARELVEQPAARMMEAAGRTLQSDVPADKREAVAKAIEADVKQYVAEALPLARERAIQAAPSTIGVVLQENFSEDELKQLIRWFDSPVNKKYQQLSAQMQKAFVQKLVADSRPLIEPKIQGLERKVRASLGVPAAHATASATPRTATGAAKAASHAAKASGP